MKFATLMVGAIAFSAVAAGCASELVAPDEPASLDRINRTDRYPVAFTTFNPCPPMEPVAIEGFVQYNTHADVEPGSTEVKQHLVLHGNGIGLLTGSKYVLQQNSKYESSFSFPPYQFESSTDTRYRLIRQGSEDNFYAEFTFSYVCDETGCRIVENEQERACRG